ncbi:hypothetical protein HELRODRAFT_178864 [Helobdella robusta]|uniref:Desmoplakin SH3 domain-containing protein n=1 Tax=Helobdella robusta TaxID=6412 RepID=T1FDU1_HELRO|nr:hypothetical protein HELRODRAFT_178864 [Helobdella robusta]ESN95946.1 hypothetical protein HELRODRAFT_178864 [Helobdella robusta]
MIVQYYHNLHSTFDRIYRALKHVITANQSYDGDFSSALLLADELRAVERSVTSLAADVSEIIATLRNIIPIRERTIITSSSSSSAPSAAPEVASATTSGRKEVIAVVICDYSVKEVNLAKNDRVTIIDRPSLILWKVKTSQGHYLDVPSALVVIVGYDDDLVKSVKSLYELFTDYVARLKTTMMGKMMMLLSHVFKPQYNNLETILIENLNPETKIHLSNTINDIQSSLCKLGRTDQVKDLPGINYVNEEVKHADRLRDVLDRIMNVNSLLDLTNQRSYAVTVDLKQQQQQQLQQQHFKRLHQLDDQAFISHIRDLSNFLFTFDSQSSQSSATVVVVSNQSEQRHSSSFTKDVQKTVVLPTPIEASTTATITSVAAAIDTSYTFDSTTTTTKVITSVDDVTSSRGLSADEIDVLTIAYKNKTSDATAAPSHQTPQRKSSRSLSRQRTETSPIKTSETEHLYAAQCEEDKKFVIKSVFDCTSGLEISLNEALERRIVDADAGTYLVDADTMKTIPIAQAMSQSFIKVQSAIVKKSSERKLSVGLVTVKTLKVIIKIDDDEEDDGEDEVIENDDVSGAVNESDNDYLIKWVVDTKSNSKLSPKKALSQKVIDLPKGTFTDTANNKVINLKDAIDQNWVNLSRQNNKLPQKPDIIPAEIYESVTYAIRGVVDRRSEKVYPFLEACREGLIDRETGVYYDLLERKKYSVEEALKSGYVKGGVVKNLRDINIWDEL